VGDDRSPPDWQLDGVVFLSVADQLAMPFMFAQLVPRKNYARKALGYLYALQHGAKVIYETDDDNAPKPGMAWPGLPRLRIGFVLRWCRSGAPPGCSMAGLHPSAAPLLHHFCRAADCCIPTLLMHGL
jgi:hypothetical protein